MDNELKPEQWVFDNPRLAHDCGLALNSASLAAADAAIKAMGLPPVDEETLEETPEQNEAARIGRAVYDAVIRSLGTDSALQERGELPAVTIPELFEAYQHGM